MNIVLSLILFVGVASGFSDFEHPSFGPSGFGDFKGFPSTNSHPLPINSGHGLLGPAPHFPKLGGGLTPKRRGPPPSFWTRVVEGTMIRQKGYVSDTPFANRIVVYTLPRNLPELGLTPSATLYDFSGDNPETVVRIGKRCYLVPTNPALSFDLAGMEVINRNGTTVTIPLPEVIMLVAIDGRLTSQEVRTLVRETPTIKTFCPSGEIYQTTPGVLPPEGEVPDGQVVVSAVTLEQGYNILAPETESRQSHPAKFGRRTRGKGGKGGFSGVIFR